MAETTDHRVSSVINEKMKETSIVKKDLFSKLPKISGLQWMVLMINKISNYERLHITVLIRFAMFINLLKKVKFTCAWFWGCLFATWRTASSISSPDPPKLNGTTCVALNSFVTWCTAVNISLTSGPMNPVNKKIYSSMLGSKGLFNAGHKIRIGYLSTFTN